MLREVPGLGRSDCHAAGVVRSVKLVHRASIRRGPQVLLANAPRFRAVADVLCTIRTQQRGAAMSQDLFVVRARCLDDSRWFTPRPTLLVEVRIFPIPTALGPSA